MLASTRERVGSTTPGRRRPPASINRAGRKLLTLDGLFQYARDLLRERSMFGFSALLQGFLKVIGHVRAYEDPFPVRHILRASPFFKEA